MRALTATGHCTGSTAVAIRPRRPTAEAACAWATSLTPKNRPPSEPSGHCGAPAADRKVLARPAACPASRRAFLRLLARPIRTSASQLPPTIEPDTDSHGSPPSLPRRRDRASLPFPHAQMTGAGPASNPVATVLPAARAKEKEHDRAEDW